jgi:hypothetical protein
MREGADTRACRYRTLYAGEVVRARQEIEYLGTLDRPRKDWWGRQLEMKVVVGLRFRLRSRHGHVYLPPRFLYELELAAISPVAKNLQPGGSRQLIDQRAALFSVRDLTPYRRRSADGSAANHRQTDPRYDLDIAMQVRRDAGSC